MHRCNQTVAVCQRYILAHILKFFDNRCGKSGQFDSFRRCAIAANPRQIEDLIKRLCDIGNGIAHFAALALVLHRLHPHSEGRQRRFEIMADCAQHHVFFIEHSGDPPFHRIVRFG